jgi:hypothetical protein
VSYTAADPSIQNQTGATHKDGTFVGQSIRDTLAHYGIPTVLAVLLLVLLAVMVVAAVVVG